MLTLLKCCCLSVVFIILSVFSVFNSVFVLVRYKATQALRSLSLNFAAPLSPLRHCG